MSPQIFKYCFLKVRPINCDFSEGFYNVLSVIIYWWTSKGYERCMLLNRPDSDTESAVNGTSLRSVIGYILLRLTSTQHEFPALLYLASVMLSIRFFFFRKNGIYTYSATCCVYLFKRIRSAHKQNHTQPLLLPQRSSIVFNIIATLRSNDFYRLSVWVLQLAWNLIIHVFMFTEIHQTKHSATIWYLISIMFCHKLLNTTSPVSFVVKKLVHWIYMYIIYNSEISLSFGNSIH